jgi:hypothetical protein
MSQRFLLLRKNLLRTFKNELFSGLKLTHLGEFLNKKKACIPVHFFPFCKLGERVPVLSDLFSEGVEDGGEGPEVGLDVEGEVPLVVDRVHVACTQMLFENQRKNNQQSKITIAKCMNIRTIFPAMKA